MTEWIKRKWRTVFVYWLHWNASRGLLPGYEIPSWCRMHPYDHFDGIGGCWGISSGRQSQKGEDYCRQCEFHKDMTPEKFRIVWNAVSAAEQADPEREDEP